MKLILVILATAGLTLAAQADSLQHTLDDIDFQLWELNQHESQLENDRVNQEQLDQQLELMKLRHEIKMQEIERKAEEKLKADLAELNANLERQAREEKAKNPNWPFQPKPFQPSK